MRAAVELGGDAGVRADELHVHLGIRAGHKDLVARAARHKRRERMRKRDFARRRHAAGDAHHVRLLNAAVHRALGIFLFKGFCAHCAHEIGVERNDPLVFVRQTDERAAICVAHIHGVFFDLCTDLNTHLLTSPSSSSAACISASASARSSAVTFRLWLPT